MARMSGLEAKRASWSARIIYWFAKRNLGHRARGNEDSRLLSAPSAPACANEHAHASQGRATFQTEAAGYAEDRHAHWLPVLN